MLCSLFSHILHVDYLCLLYNIYIIIVLYSISVLLFFQLIGYLVCIEWHESDCFLFCFCVPVVANLNKIVLILESNNLLFSSPFIQNSPYPGSGPV